jgi:hypothetical protein
MRDETQLHQRFSRDRATVPREPGGGAGVAHGGDHGNRLPEFSQATFPFVHPWELETTSLNTTDDHREVHACLGRLKQCVGSLAAGMSQAFDRAIRVEESLQTITSALCRIEVAVNQRSLLDDEVRRFRSKELRDDIQGPLFRGLIRLLDRIAEEKPRIEQIRALCRRTSYPEIGRVLQWIVDTRAADKADLRNVLAQFGVQRYRSKPGITLDGARHERVEVIATTRVELYGRIARHRRYGYHRPDDDWVVRRERVDVYAANSK